MPPLPAPDLCPHCGHVFSRKSSATVGTIGGCLACGGLLRFDADLLAQVLPPEAEAGVNPLLRLMMSATRAAIQKYGPRPSRPLLTA